VFLVFKPPIHPPSSRYPRSYSGRAPPTVPGRVSSAAGRRAPAMCHGLRCGRRNELQGHKRGETEGDGRDIGEEEPEQSGSVPRILRDGANPHLEGIFPREQLRSHRSPSKQSRERIRGSPTKHTRSLSLSRCLC
jgi:hypothetical protein